MSIEEEVVEQLVGTKHTYELGQKYPYGGTKATNWVESAALGICADLCDRSGIKHAMDDPDEAIQREIVRAMVAQIRYAFAHYRAEDVESGVARTEERK